MKIIAFQGPLTIAEAISKELKIDLILDHQERFFSDRDILITGSCVFNHFANADCKIIAHMANEDLESSFSIESGMLIWSYCSLSEPCITSLVNWIKYHLYRIPLLISVIIPVHNRQDHIRFCLEALFQQTFSKDCYEIIVIDDGSCDSTAAVAENFQTTIIRTKNCGPGAARNRGIEASKGEILVFLDADIIVEEDFLKQIHDYFLYTNAMVLLGARRHLPQGYVNNKSGEYSLDSREKLLRRYSFCLNHLNCPWSLAYTCNFSVSKNFLSQIRFDESFIGWGLEDIDFAYQLYQQGAYFLFSKNISGYHLYHDRQFTMERYLSWQQNLERFLKKYPEEEKVQAFSLFKQVFHPKIKANYFDIFDQFENSLQSRSQMDIYDLEEVQGDPVEWLKTHCCETKKDFILLSSHAHWIMDIYLLFFKHPNLKSYLSKEDWRESLCQS